MKTCLPKISLLQKVSFWFLLAPHEAMSFGWHGSRSSDDDGKLHFLVPGHLCGRRRLPKKIEMNCLINQKLIRSQILGESGMSALKTTTAREWLIMLSCGSMIVAGLVLKISWKIFGRSAAHLLRLLRSVAHGVSPPFGRRSTGKPWKRFHRCKPPWWYIMVHPNLVSSNTWEIIHVYYIIWYYDRLFSIDRETGCSNPLKLLAVFFKQTHRMNGLKLCKRDKFPGLLVSQCLESVAISFRSCIDQIPEWCPWKYPQVMRCGRHPQL